MSEQLHWIKTITLLREHQLVVDDRTGKDISAQLELKGTPIQQAADNTMQKVKEWRGGGGVIAIDKNGNIGILYLGDGMYRVYVGDDGKIVVKIYDK